MDRSHARISQSPLHVHRRRGQCSRLRPPQVSASVIVGWHTPVSIFSCADCPGEFFPRFSRQVRFPKLKSFLFFSFTFQKFLTSKRELAIHVSQTLLCRYHQPEGMNCGLHPRCVVVQSALSFLLPLPPLLLLLLPLLFWQMMLAKFVFKH